MKGIIAQSLGYIGLLIIILSFQKKSRERILLYHLLSSFFYCLHFFMLGALTGSIMNFLAIARSYVFYHKDKEWANKKIWLYLFITVFVVGGIITWQSIYSILPTIAMVAGTIGSWMNKPKHLRIIFLSSRPCWFIYNFISGSMPGMITEVIMTISIVIGIVRHDIFKTFKKKECDVS